ncbi:MAG: cyclic nucleotide-binding domain-containing protein [Actinomycetota bacterium]
MDRPTIDQRLQTLKSIPLFEGFSKASLRTILDMSGELEAAPGQVLVQPKMEGSGLFVIEEGTVVVERSGKNIELGPGQFFGELALLTATTRTARVRAKTPARLIAIGRSEFRTLLDSEPKMAIAMLEVLAKRLADSR